MIELGSIKSTDVVYDLGCGDGLISLAAGRVGARCIGFDIDMIHLNTAKKLALKEGLDQLVEFRSDDVLTLDLSEATCLVMVKHILWLSVCLSVHENILPYSHHLNTI
jgi:predicted RNA methylase